MTDDLPAGLPPNIIVLPAEQNGQDWRFNLATGIQADGNSGPCEAGLEEADFRTALAEQGYDAAAISLAVVEAIKAGQAAPVTPDEGEPF